MRIAIDARAVFWTGIGTYIRNLLGEIARLDTSHDFVVLVPRGDQERFNKEFSLPDNFSVHVVDGSYYSVREQTLFVHELAGVKADLFHFTHFNVPLLFNRPYVVTIHDTTRFVFPGQKRQRLLEQVAYELVFKQAVTRAHGIICVTEATRRELMHLPFIAHTPVTVVHEAVSQPFLGDVSTFDRQKVRALIDINGPFVLYVGVWMSHKNIRRMLDAFALVRERYPRLKFVITGKPVPGYIDFVSVVRELGLSEHVIFPGYVPSSLLPALYAESAALMFASLYEGFGLPALEAAAVGTPVVTSNVSSLPEVMGKAALFVNPESVNAIAEGVQLLLSDKEKQVLLSSCGRVRARDFSWEENARQTLQVYEAAL